MATNFARQSGQKALPVAEAKARVVELIKDGHTREQACAVVQRSVETYRDWMKKDPEFKAAVESIRAVQREVKDSGRPEVPDFDVFCRDWLKQPLFPHQLRMWDVIEGREPRDMHDSMDYRSGLRNRVLINVPPEHAKSTTFTVNYVVWLIHRNPDVRVVIMSQGKDMAKKFLYEIKQKLTSPLYREMWMRFGPEGGWKDPDNSWTTDAIYVRGKGGDVVQKDPTVQVLGLGGQIYGARADYIFLDDLITTKNARELSKQEMVLDREIESRLPSEKEGGGLLAILGTRVAPMDLYRHLHDAEDYIGNPTWTYFRQPAVLDYGSGDPSTWVTLWPEKWDGPSLARKRKPGTWNLIYQQLNVDDEMTFKAEAVEASINRGRLPGPLSAANRAHRRGMDGLYLVGGIDPATTGNTAMIVAGLDRETGKRYVIDGWNKPNASSEQIIRQMQVFINEYHLQEFVVERNAFQRFLADLPQVREFAQARGCRIQPHYTTSNKYDEDWGVQTMAPLFDSCCELDERGVNKVRDGGGLIELPTPRQNEWVSALVQQLTTWAPQGNAQKQKFDLVMALWFTHIAFDRVMRRAGRKTTHLDSPFMTPAARKRQSVISLADLRRERQMLEETG